MRNFVCCALFAFFLGALWSTLPAQVGRCDERLANRACRSVHLQYRAPESTAFYNEIAVEQSSPGTYFAANGFSKGYFGIQELYDGKKVVLFSIWDPGKQNNPNSVKKEQRVKMLAQGEGVRVKRFGGEGTGGQSFYDYDWKLGETYRFLVRAKPDGERVAFSGYFYLPKKKEWQLLATFSTLTKDRTLRGYYSFVEDFRRNGVSATQVRKAWYGNGWVKKTDGEWQQISNARFTADRNPATNINAGGINAGEKKNRFFLVTGGKTENTATKLRERIDLKQSDQSPPNDLPPSDLPSGDSSPHKSKTNNSKTNDVKTNNATASNSKPTTAGTSAENVLRVLTYNIKHGRGNDGKLDLKRAAEVIKKLQPDLVALQEIDNKAKRSGKVDQAKRLGKLTGMHSAFGSFFDFQGGEYGMAILSKTPLLNAENLRLPNGAEPRTALIVRVKPKKSGSEILFVSVHFYATETQRLAQATTLLKKLANEQRPVIIAGDFNSSPKSKVLELFAEQWAVPDKGDDHFTFSSDRPRSEIDFIISHPQSFFKVQTIDVIDEPVVSDHRPVIAELLLKDELLP